MMRLSTMRVTTKYRQIVVQDAEVASGGTGKRSASTMGLAHPYSISGVSSKISRLAGSWREWEQWK